MGPDCDDRNRNVNPGAPENGATNCDDGIDNNCDGVDSICGSELDLDNDGFSDKDGDCDDMNPNINPGRMEIYYNDLDDDCNPQTNDDDQDGDGFAAQSSMGPDCDDLNPNINPRAEDIPGNGVDENCDGIDRVITADDRDGDGVSELDGDCDDDNAMVSPNLQEIPYNSLDDDCNANTRDNDLDRDGFNSPLDCDDNNAMVNPNMAEAYYNGIDDDCNERTNDRDADGDGFDAQVVGGNDCNDDLASANPNAQEVPYNGVDDDCNASTPDNDLDGDGFTRDNDCNDDDANVNPDIIENASTNCSDGVDNNCVGGDIQCDAGAVDSDGDGTPDDQDCEPNNADVPGPIEIANNGIDDDCDGEVDNACIDDAFDDSNYNDGPANASAMDDYNGRYESLLVLCPNDTDWYQIRLEAGDGLEVDVRFEDALGDIDVRLYRRNNGALTEAGLTVVDSSTSTNDNEVVYTARANVGDTYFIKVYQFGANPQRVNYDMMINVFEGCQDDAVGLSGEHNDTLSEANNLPGFGENRQICDYDEDWYSFNLNRSQNIRIDTMFQNQSGDLDVELYNADTQTRVEASRFFFNNEVINIENLAAGNYALKVYGHNGSTNPYRVFLSSGSSETAEFTDNADYDIPDGGATPGVYTTPAIRFPAVPAGSIVRKLRIRQLDINHRCLGDLQVTLLWDGVPITTLWNRDGENCDDAGLDDDSLTSVGCNSLSGLLGRDICFENRYYPAYDENAPDQPLFQNGFDPMFAGLDAQGDLTVEIKDFVSGNVGKLVKLQVELEYFIP
jgi:subtilisin-like proprotein convertase family protein